MEILGIDFTSKPTRRKPITCLHCSFEDSVLQAKNEESWSDFTGFEHALRRPGPWVAGIDFPFGQSLRFIENIQWPRNWEQYVQHVASLGRSGFREALNAYRETRLRGDKEHRRKTDVEACSISPQKLYGVPVALMFFEGAPRLLEANVFLPGIRENKSDRVVVEAYPGVLARHLVDRNSYKQDTKKLQTEAQAITRNEIFSNLSSKKFYNAYGFKVEASSKLCDDPSGDRLDALLCAIQAAWAYTKKDTNYGAPKYDTSIEGWIAHPRE